MGIYSANRVTRVSGGTMSPDMSYVGTIGLARCMYESALNDYAMDESMLMQDFKEVQAVREGTVMGTELRSIQEASIKGFFDKCKEMLTKLGQKIMGVFRTVYAKLSQWIVRNGKAYVAMHRKTVLSKDISKLKIKKYRMPKGSFNASTTTSTLKINIDKIDVENPTKHAGSPEEYGKSVLKNFLHDKDRGEYTKWLMDQAYEAEAEIDGSKIQGRLQTILDNVSAGNKPIKELKKTEKDLIKKIKDAKSALDKLEKKINGNETKTSSDEAKLSGIPYVRAEVSALQTAVNTITSATIKVCRFGIRQDRSVIAQIVAYSPNAPKNEGANLYMLEAAEDAEDEFDEEMDSPEEVEVAEDMPEFEDIEASDDSDDDDE